MTLHPHPWHDVSAGSRLPEYVNGIIEIPKGSRAKYEIDKQSGLIRLDRVIYASMYYPANYGFIPQSYGGDQDPLDILVLSQVSLVPLCVVEARVIGVMRMLDNGDADDKIIAAAAGDPSVNHLRDIGELPPYFMTELRNFFEEYKKLEKRTIVVDEFLGHEAAQQIVGEALEHYRTLSPR